VYFNKTVLERFSKDIQISNFIKIHPVGVELFHADGKRDKTKLTVAFCNFANVPKNRKKDKTTMWR